MELLHKDSVYVFDVLNTPLVWGGVGTDSQVKQAFNKWFMAAII